MDLFKGKGTGKKRNEDVSAPDVECDMAADMEGGYGDDNDADGESLTFSADSTMRKRH